MTLTIKDETFAGDILNELQIEFESETITVKDIIVSRVEQEVAQHNLKTNDRFKGLVVPTAAEKQANGYWLKTPQKIDAEKQVYVALDAFLNNGFFVLIDAVQADSLEQQVQVKQDTKVSFIKLTPLIGG